MLVKKYQNISFSFLLCGMMICWCFSQRVIVHLIDSFYEIFFLMMQVIPRQLCDNAGFDATDVLNKLRQKHALPTG